METRIHSPRFLRQRKFMLMLPVLALPFIIVVFFLLGGGKGVSGMNAVHSSGLNLNVPDAHIKKGQDKTKLSLYDEASRDSLTREQKIKNDPYYLLEHPDSDHVSAPARSDVDKNEARIMEKLEKLKNVIGQKPVVAEAPVSVQHSTANRELIEKLVSGNTASSRALNAHNPELDQLNRMLDKVMAIQHPEILADSLAKVAETHSEPSFQVSLPKESKELVAFNGESNASLVAYQTTNRFYSISESNGISDVGNAIEAVIPEDQKVVSGSKVKIRLLNDIQINGHLIPKNQFIYGNCSFGNHRVKITITSIYVRNSFLPVSLEVYDLDGMPGISVSESMVADATKESGNQALNTLGLTSLNPTAGAQAIDIGVQAGKSLISKKVKTVRVPLRAGYHVLLRNTQN